MPAPRRLSKSYAGLPAVDGVSFSIRPGEILGYLGPKDPVRALPSKCWPGCSSGEILFRGERISHDLAGYKRRLGYVPEEANLYSFLSGWEYLDLVGTLRGMERRRLAEKSAVDIMPVILPTIIAAAKLSWILGWSRMADVVEACGTLRAVTPDPSLGTSQPEQPHDRNIAV